MRYYLWDLYKATLFFFGFGFCYETGYEAIRDCGPYPDFCKHIIGVFADWLEIDINVIEHGDEYIDNTDGPQIALGVALPVLAGIEEGEHAEQKHRESETRQVEGIVGQWRQEEDVAQQHRNAH